MRAARGAAAAPALLALGVLALAAAPAAAQDPLAVGALPTSLELVLTPPAGPVQPLGAMQAVGVEVRYTVLEAAPHPGRATAIVLGLHDPPPWLVGTISPEVVYLQPGAVPCGCERTLVAQAALLVSTTSDAPAFRPSQVALRGVAEANGAHAAAEAVGSADVVPGFHSVLDVATPDPSLRLAAGEPAEVRVLAVNGGNGPTRVTLEVLEGRPNVRIELPAPWVVGSLQAGDAANAGQASVRLVAEGPFSPGSVLLRARGAHAHDPAVPGEAHTLAVLVAPLGLVAGAPGSLMPVAGLALAAAAVGGVWLRQRSRSGGQGR